MENEDLKTGMILETGKGTFVMVLKGTENGDIVSGDTWQPIYKNTNVIEDLKVMRIYQPIHNASYLGTERGFSKRRDLRKDIDYKIIWERKEKEMTIAEIEKELGYSIKVIKED